MLINPIQFSLVGSVPIELTLLLFILAAFLIMTYAVIQTNRRLLKEIAERETAEQKMAEAQKFLNSIVENIPDMIFVKDAKELRFVRFNKAGEMLLGFTTDQMIGKNDYDFFPKEEADFFTTKDRLVVEGGRMVDIPEETIHTRLLGPRTLHTKKIPILDDEGKPRYLLGIAEDVTDKKRAQEELMKKTFELAKSNAEREQLELFAYLASHDLQEPLNKITSFADLLQEQSFDKIDKKGRDYLERMKKAANRMKLLIDDLLKFSVVATKKEEMVSVDLTSLIHELILDLEFSILKAKGKIELAPLPSVKADPVQMRQLFQNLILNALKFCKEGEPPIIHIKSHDLFPEITQIFIEDNGIGFDEKYLDRLFKPFARLRYSSQREGSGIGLAICQKILERHGGQITAKSEVGKGSVFIVSLPKI